MKPAEPELVRRAAGGDRGAFATLVEGEWSRLVRLARSVVGESEAEDAVQDALVLAWRKLAGLRDVAAFRPWLVRIVARNCLRRARHRAGRLLRTRPLEEAAQVEAPNTANPGDLDVARTLARLAPRQRAVMHLTVVEGMSDGEIGRLLGITAGSVRAHRRRARHRLAALWKREPARDRLFRETPAGVGVTTCTESESEILHEPT